MKIKKLFLVGSLCLVSLINQNAFAIKNEEVGKDDAQKIAEDESQKVDLSVESNAFDKSDSENPNNSVQNSDNVERSGDHATSVIEPAPN
jgi:hypothetical protein